MCLAVALVASWSLTQEVTGLRQLFLSLGLLNSVKIFRENLSISPSLLYLVSCFTNREQF